MINSSLAKEAKATLKRIQEDLDVRLKEYLSSSFLQESQTYHESTKVASDAYSDIVSRGGKRLRGAFVIKGYDMFKGESNPEIYKAAMAVELVHAYLLVIDDFNDMSNTRRGGPTAHKILEKYHIDNKLKGNPFHFGISEATIIALAGQHSANNLLLSMNFPLELVKKAIENVNDAINITALGQVRDIYNQTADNLTSQDVLKVHEYKTSVYTYLNPIQLGAILAGATEEELSKLHTYTKPAGVAFQIQDDILGMFGDPKDTGKSNKDDLMEGKLTLLITEAMKNAKEDQKNEILQALGNRNLTNNQHKRVQDIIIQTGSLTYSKEYSKELVVKAKEELHNNFGRYEDTDGFKFLSGIADYMIEREY